MSKHIMGQGIRIETIEELNSLPSPKPMGSKHYPIRDDEFFPCLEENIVPHKWSITRREYLLDCNMREVCGHLVEDGPEWHRYFNSGGPKWNTFALYELESDTQDYTRIVAGRNSSTQHFKAELGAGNQVTVCSNLMFYASVVVGRKHTRHIMRDLPVLMNKGMQRISDEFVNQDRRIEAYKETYLTTKDADHIIMSTLRDQGIPSSHIKPWMQEYTDPSHEEFQSRTAWSLQNAFTEVGKRWSFNDLSQRTCKLTSVMDKLLGVTPVNTDLINIDGVEDVEVSDNTL